VSEACLTQAQARGGGPLRSPASLPATLPPGNVLTPKHYRRQSIKPAAYDPDTHLCNWTGCGQKFATSGHLKAHYYESHGTGTAPGSETPGAGGSAGGGEAASTGSGPSGAHSGQEQASPRVVYEVQATPRAQKSAGTKVGVVK